MSCIVFTGGGTAGHVFPGIAVAEALPEDVDIVWLGSNNGSDAAFVSTLSRVRFVSIPSGKYRRYFSFRNFIDLFKIIYSFFVCIFILLKFKPILLFSKGGFVSTPPCIAAYFLRIPVITHECDFSPGLATRINAYFSKKILISYPETSYFFKQRFKNKLEFTGNPVRSIFYKANGDKTKKFLNKFSKKPIILVLGGSLGAEQINELIYENITEIIKDFIVIHQTGKLNIERANTVLEKLKKLGNENVVDYYPCPFISEELPDLIFSSFLVVSRAGSNTVWELATLGKPMLLIPLEKGSSRGDQVENALYFSNKNAAITLRCADLNSLAFLQILYNLRDDKTLYSSLINNANKLANGNVAEKIVEIIKKEVNTNI